MKRRLRLEAAKGTMAGTMEGMEFFGRRTQSPTVESTGVSQDTNSTTGTDRTCACVDEGLCS